MVASQSVVKLTKAEYEHILRASTKRVFLKSCPNLYRLPRGREVGLECWEGAALQRYFFARIIRHTHIGVEVEIE